MCTAAGASAETFSAGGREDADGGEDRKAAALFAGAIDGVWGDAAEAARRGGAHVIKMGTDTARDSEAHGGGRDDFRSRVVLCGAVARAAGGSHLMLSRQHRLMAQQQIRSMGFQPMPCAAIAP